MRVCVCVRVCACVCMCLLYVHVCVCVCAHTCIRAAAGVRPRECGANCLRPSVSPPGKGFLKGDSEREASEVEPPGCRLSHCAGRRAPVCCGGSRNVGTDPISQEAGRRHREAQEGTSGPVTNAEVLEVRTGRDLKMLRSPEGRTYPRSPPALESGLGLRLCPH